jgi:phosphohistidine phosphatase
MNTNEQLTHRIHLLRHVKSSWDDPGLPDHDRPLAGRGRRAGKRLRRHIRATGLRPQVVLCSSAVRAVQTWEGIRSGVPPDTRVEVSDDLYGADPGSLLRRINRLPESVGSVLLIGHSPAIEELAIGLSGTGDAAALDRITAKYPTGGLATLTVLQPWSELSWQGASLEAFVVPREL